MGSSWWMFAGRCCKHEAATGNNRAAGLNSDVVAGRSVARYRACFGSRRSPVQIRAPRLGVGLPARRAERARAVARANPGGVLKHASTLYFIAGALALLASLFMIFSDGFVPQERFKAGFYFFWAA